jgi:LysM repeat protein
MIFFSFIQLSVEQFPTLTPFSSGGCFASLFHPSFPTFDQSANPIAMNPLKILVPSVIAVALASCAAHKDEYDTANPYGTGDGTIAGADAAAGTQTYDTPAAYEDAGSTAAVNSPNVPAQNPVNDPAPVRTTTPSHSAPTSGGGTATSHTVVKGDTLGGIAKKYKVSIASIKAANGMTKDTVVLGKTLKIPSH